MYALATTTISVFRGSSTDEFGDEVEDNSSPLYSGIPASLIENTKRMQGAPSQQRIFDPASDTPREIYFFICRVQHGTDILLTDRIMDENDSTMYAIDRITAARSPVNMADLHLDLTTQA